MWFYGSNNGNKILKMETLVLMIFLKHGIVDHISGLTDEIHVSMKL